MSPEVFEIVFPLWIRAFLTTLAIEVPIFVLVARWKNEPMRRAALWRLALAGVVGTCFTHPLLWFVWPKVVHEYWAYIVSGELLIAIIESFTFFAIARPIKLTRAIAASYIANAISFFGDLLLRLLGL